MCNHDPSYAGCVFEANFHGKKGLRKALEGRITILGLPNLPSLGKFLSLIGEKRWLTIHLLDSNTSMAHKHMTSSKQPTGNFRLCIHNISKLDLLLAKLFLILLQPSLIILN